MLGYRGVIVEGWLVNEAEDRGFHALCSSDGKHRLEFLINKPEHTHPHANVQKRASDQSTANKQASTMSEAKPRQKARPVVVVPAVDPLRTDAQV
jgi:hypothetical protein